MNLLTNQTKFFEAIFGKALKNNQGQIEIRTFPEGQRPQQYFCSTVEEASQKAYDLCNNGIDVYYGVNPRTGGAGKKENVHFLTTFHAEVDYGTDGHKKKPIHDTCDQALKAIIGVQVQTNHCHSQRWRISLLLGPRRTN